jgi:uncharacterized protein YceK
VKRLVVALVAVLALSACGSQGYSEGPDEPNKGQVPAGASYLEEVEVDGTTCVIYRDGSMGGIDCNFVTNGGLTSTTP